MKRIRVFFNDVVLRPGQQVRLSNQDAHHLREVLRVEAGWQIDLVDQAQSTFKGVISAMVPEVLVKIIETKNQQICLSRVSHLCFALCKGDKNEFVIEKACELGVQNLVLWQSEHSVAKVPATKAQDRIERWQKIALAASKQAARCSVMEVCLQPNLSGVIEMLSHQKVAGCFLSLANDAREFRLIKDALDNLAMVVGPEGDFSAAEEKLLRQYQYMPLSLGPLILRAETAAVAGVSAVNCLWGHVSEMPGV